MTVFIFPAIVEATSFPSLTATTRKPVIKNSLESIKNTAQALALFITTSHKKPASTSILSASGSNIPPSFVI